MNYDYTETGAYFVTICSWNRECLFGEILEGEMHLNEYGDDSYYNTIKNRIVEENPLFP